MAEFESKRDVEIIAKRIKGFRGYPPMFHTHCELIYVLNGELSMTVGDETRVLKRGEIAAVFPYVVHSYEDAPEAEVCMLLFSPRAVSAYESALLHNKPKTPWLNENQRISSLTERLIELKGRSENDLASAYMNVIVGELMMVLTVYRSETSDEGMLKQILEYCSDNYTDPDISEEKIAVTLYISRSYVSKIFANKIRYSFRNYINELRISKAKKLLSKSKMKIIEIMLECGFKNQSSFNRVFYDLNGMSPTEYRKMTEG